VPEPDMIRWTLRFVVLSDHQQQICRHFFEQLIRDPYVIDAQLEESQYEPYSRLIHVTLRVGHEQPYSPLLRALDRRYPERLTEDQTNAITLREAIERTNEDSNFRAVVDTITRISNEYGPSKSMDPVPDHVRIGKWLQAALSDERFEIVSIVYGNPHLVTLAPWKTNGRFTVKLGDVLQQYVTCEAPVEGAPWYKRLDPDWLAD